MLIWFVHLNLAYILKNFGDYFTAVISNNNNLSRMDKSKNLPNINSQRFFVSSAASKVFKELRILFFAAEETINTAKIYC